MLRAAMICLVYAHPYPDRSRANQLLVEAVRELPGVVLRSLYDLYPDFGIDVQAEQRALEQADVIVWQHPLYWYTVPGLLKHWFDKVLAHGWAYGAGGNALRGKRCLWVATTGGDDAAFSPQGMHGHAFEAFVPVVLQTARFCGMEWLEPLIVHGAHRVPLASLRDSASAYRARLLALSEEASRARA